MKTLSKKLISLMLVALMLVAAMPVMALAEEVDTYDEPAVVDNGDDVSDFNESPLAVTVTVYRGGDVYAGPKAWNNCPFDFEDKINDDMAAAAATALKAINVSAPSSKNYDLISVELSGNSLVITYEVKAHDHIWTIATNPDDAHKPDENGHYMICTVTGCGAYSDYQVAHTDDEIKSKTPETKTTCKEVGKTAQITYKCGYTVGGEPKDEELAEHTYKNGKCTVCGALEPTSSYSVYIVYKGDNIGYDGTVELTDSAIATYSKNLNLSNAKAILSKTASSTNLYSTYAGSMNASVFSKMEIDDGTIFITVNKNLTDTANEGTEKITVTVIDGSLSDTRELTVGKSYFNYDLTLGNNNNKSLASVRVTYEVNGKTYTRTVKKGDSDAKVQAYDTQVELLWDAKQVKINFYRNAADGAELVSTMTIRAGETIDNLPLLDGQYVSWYLESGELLQEGRTYDFSSTTVRAYPYAGGEVYLQIYKNGDTKTPVSNNPVNVTAKVQKNGIISASDLTKTIENAVGKKNLKITGLFDFDGWEEYKSSKSTKYASSTIDVGTADERTGVQFLYVMVNGGSSSTADSSNPKTGDNAMIGSAAAVLAVAVIGLGTTAVVLKKKELF